MKLLRSQADMLDAYRDRIRELGLAHATVDSISGLPDGYTGKLMCGMKNPGPKAHELLCGALGIAFVVQVDQEAAAKVESRWVKRKRALNKVALASRFSIEAETPQIVEITPELERKLRMRELGKRGGKIGGKRRLKTMGKRARQQVAAHAARTRWARVKARASA